MYGPDMPFSNAGSPAIPPPASCPLSASNTCPFASARTAENIFFPSAISLSLFCENARLVASGLPVFNSCKSPRNCPCSASNTARSFNCETCACTMSRRLVATELRRASICSRKTSRQNRCPAVRNTPSNTARTTASRSVSFSTALRGKARKRCGASGRFGVISIRIRSYFSERIRNEVSVVAHCFLGCGTSLPA